MPSATVITRPQISCERLFLSSPQCAQVTVAPEVSRISVLSAGMPIAPIGVNCSAMPGPGHGPARLESGPDELLAFEAAEIGHRKHAHVEQRAEERAEEHDFGEDEPAHAPAEAGVDLLVVLAGLGFVRDRAEPAGEHVDQQRAAPRTPRYLPHAHAVEPRRGARAPSRAARTTRRSARSTAAGT